MEIPEKSLDQNQESDELKNESKDILEAFMNDKN